MLSLGHLISFCCKPEILKFRLSMILMPKWFLFYFYMFFHLLVISKSKACRNCMKSVRLNHFINLWVPKRSVSFFLYWRTSELKGNFIVFLYFLEFNNPFSREKWQWPLGAVLNLDKSYTSYGEKYQAKRKKITELLKVTN